MSPLEKSLLEEACGAREPRLLIRSRTRVDAGRWWRTTPLWLGIDGGDLFLLAVARRKYIERVPLADCHQSRYCHSSGQLMVAPTEILRINHIALSPGEAIRVLDAINSPVF
jgi:hypothetical protein